jgi:hypothetical protein
MKTYVKYSFNTVGSPLEYAHLRSEDRRQQRNYLFIKKFLHLMEMLSLFINQVQR